ncbi:MAG: T9SS type A sorting domain-containing protein, partial [Ignavibacteriales bacterium]|nr:T9SS type A sorting domain-containing protein [Ignavibacteriales bacterium]
SGNLYMAAYGGGLDGNLRIIDRTTGASTLVGSFNGGKEVMMMAFPSTTPWLSLDTTNGSVPPSGYVDIEVTFDANVNMGGDYFADIMISSNDPGHPEYKVPAHMHVIGVPNIVTSTDSLSFGDVYTGQTDTLFVAFMNDGTDVLEVTDITNSLGVFSTNLTSFSVEVGDTQFVEFYFTPTETGLRTDAFVVASNDTGNPSYYIYAQGNGIPGTGLEDELLGIPKEYSVDQNFPNPFNPSTTIRFGLPEVSSVSIIVYDVLGRKVTELFEGIKTAGFHRVVWNANVASGVYLFRIVAKSENSDKKFVDVRKMILLK